MLLLACDGLWDVLSNDNAIIAIRTIFADGGNVMTVVAEEMLDMALHAGKGTIQLLFYYKLLSIQEKAARECHVPSSISSRLTCIICMM
jgi:hypothetical protein